MQNYWHAVDGSEIRRSPVEVGSFSHYLQGFSTIPGGDRRISEPSIVTKHFRYLKWRNPHVYKLYGYGLCKGKPTLKTAL